jgi:hypothetical protein
MCTVLVRWYEVITDKIFFYSNASVIIVYASSHYLYQNPRSCNIVPSVEVLTSRVFRGWINNCRWYKAAVSRKALATRLLLVMCGYVPYVRRKKREEGARDEGERDEGARGRGREG